MNNVPNGVCVYWDAPMHTDQRDDRQFLAADRKAVPIGKTVYQVQTFMPLDADACFMDRIGSLIRRENA